MDSGMGTSKPIVTSSQETLIEGPPTSPPLSPSLLDQRKQHKYQQTSPTTSPGEDHQLARITQQHTIFLRDLLNAKSFDMIQRWKGRTSAKRAISDEQHLAHSKKAKNSNKVCRKLCMDDIGQSRPAKPNNLRYQLRYACNDPEISISSDSLINYVKTQAIYADSIADNWTGSIMETVIDTLIRVCDAADGQTLRKSSQLTNHLLNMLANSVGCEQDCKQEALSNIILKLCESPDIAEHVVDEIILSLLHGFEQGYQHELLKQIAFTEYSFHLVRILLKILKRFEAKYDATGEEWAARPKTDKSVLYLWRNLCRTSIQTPVSSQTTSTQRYPQIEKLLNYALNNVRQLSPLLMEASQIGWRIWVTPQNAGSDPVSDDVVRLQ